MTPIIRIPTPMTRIFKKRTHIILPELSYKVSGLLFQVHNQLGRYGREKQYADAFEGLLKQNLISYTRERANPNLGDKPDFIVEGSIIVELKAKPRLMREDYYQTIRYLQLHQKPLGILVNFRNRFLRPHRLLPGRKKFA
jgi:GxxExxY protein